MEKYKVTLTADERYELEQLVRKGKAAARKLAHAPILLLADEGDDRTGRPDEQIAETLGVSPRTVSRVRKRFVTEGLEQAVNPRRQPRRPEKIKLDEEATRQLVELACSDPPDGRGSWTLQLLADRLVVLGQVESVSRETVRKALKKTFRPIPMSWGRSGASYRASYFLLGCARRFRIGHSSVGLGLPCCAWQGG